MTIESSGVQIQRLINPDEIDPNPWQLRKTIDQEKLAELADDIDQRGLLQAIVVRPKGERYELAWGQRRLEAVRLLIAEGRRKEGIDARIEELADEQIILGSIAENNAREDVDIIEETRAIQEALERVPDLRATDIAKALGISQGQLSSRLSLLRLPQEVLDQVSGGRMPWTGARELLTLVGKNCEHPEVIAAVLKRLSGLEMVTVSEVRKCFGKVAQRYFLRLDGFGLSERSPNFDIDAFQRQYPTHRVPVDQAGKVKTALATCAVDAYNDWDAMAVEAQKSDTTFHRRIPGQKTLETDGPNGIEPDKDKATLAETDAMPRSLLGSAHDGNIKAKLYERVLRLEPAQFERLVGELLRCKGLLNVEVTGRSNDGGIDGNCEIPFLKLKVAFQAKRYMRGNSVGIEPVQRLAGSITNTYDRGIFITTSAFTTSATSWVEETGQSITLIDGDELIRDMTELELGINVVPVIRHDIDEEFFSQLARQM